MRTDPARSRARKARRVEKALESAYIADALAGWDRNLEECYGGRVRRVL